MSKSSRENSKNAQNTSSDPILENIRLAHQMESEKISESIQSGQVDNLDVSGGNFAHLFEKTSPVQRQGQLKRRVDDATAIHIFTRITQAWQLNYDETRALLGNPDLDTWRAWQNGTGSAIPRETLERISYVFGIYAALKTIFSNAAQANAWPRKPNEYFAGKSALDVMLNNGLAEVRRYLDSWT